MISTRRSLLLTGLLSRAPATADCALDLSAITIGTDESPFFEHYHQLVLPVSALVQPPKDGVRIKTTSMDLESYDEEAFESFIASSGLKRELLKVHSHDVKITRDQLIRIANGEREVEVRVISAAGNYVHNFKITAYQSSLIKVRRGVRS